MPESGSGGKPTVLELPRIPHPDKILYPAIHLTRIEVVKYYAEVSSYLLEQAQGRSLTVKRWPHGVDGPMFYQKHPEPGVPIMLAGVSDLLTWVGQGALEWHAPLGYTHEPGSHDWAILDLDPNPPADWEAVAAVAAVFRKLLDLMNVRFLLKTSGQRGLHFYIRILPLGHERITRIMGHLAELVVGAVPEKATVARLKRDRGPRVYLDYLQNGHARTTVMAYSLRATPTATASAPIEWGDVVRPPAYWTWAMVLERLHERGNLFRWQGEPVDLVDVARRHGLNQ